MYMVYRTDAVRYRWITKASLPNHPVFFATAPPSPKAKGGSFPKRPSNVGDLAIVGSLHHTTSIYTPADTFWILRARARVHMRTQTRTHTHSAFFVLYVERLMRINRFLLYTRMHTHISIHQNHSCIHILRIRKDWHLYPHWESTLRNKPACASATPPTLVQASQSCCYLRRCLGQAASRAAELRPPAAGCAFLQSQSLCVCVCVCVCVFACLFLHLQPSNARLCSLEACVCVRARVRIRK